MSKNDKDKKVSPADKKPASGEKDKLKKVKDQAKMIIMNHPEILYDAKNLFNHENGKTIIEEIVPRGDIKIEDQIYPRNNYDLKEEDIRGLAVYASMIVNDDLMKYDQRTAYEDALTMAIGWKDDGKYAGKVNANTYLLILDNIGKIKKASQINPDNMSKISTEKGSKEESMDKEALMNEYVSLREKLAAIETLLDVDASDSKEAAGSLACPHCGWDKPMLAKTKFCAKCHKKVTPVPAGKGKKGDKKEKDANDELDLSSTEKIVEALDGVAESLEQENTPELMKVAFELDKIADMLEGKSKTAKTLMSDSDEAYMKSHFSPKVIEKDSDEKYMAEFNTDVSQEVAKLRGSSATSVPYSKKS